jgi:hypothetical protein
MKHFLRIILLTALVSCSTQPDDFAINIEIHYPFHPWDKFSISKVTDSTTFQYVKLYIEIDSIYYLDADKGTTFKNLIQRRDQETFVIKTLKTDSLIYPNPSDIKFIKDTVKNVIIISEGQEKTKWTLIDSIVVPEFMVKMNRKINHHDIQNIYNLVQAIKSKHESDTTPCLDGTTTMLELRERAQSFKFEKSCGYDDIKELSQLIKYCNQITNNN